MTNGAIDGKLREFELVQDRASALQSKGIVDVGTKTEIQDYRRILYHEMAHLLETESDKKANNEWIWERSNGKLARINDLVEPNKAVYNNNEIAVDDKFYRAYTGKYYGDPAKFKDRTGDWNASATEIYSIGLEHFASKDMMVMLYAKDREHFDRMQTLLESL